jgi:hypothetical protein
MVDAKHQDQYANATNNITKPPTLVLTATPVNFQEINQTDNKTCNAELTIKTVMPAVKSN